LPCSKTVIIFFYEVSSINYLRPRILDDLGLKIYHIHSMILDDLGFKKSYHLHSRFDDNGIQKLLDLGHTMRVRLSHTNTTQKQLFRCLIRAL
jgi:glucose-6-phosphate-specific signal transduction histidine kinase